MALRGARPTPELSRQREREAWDLRCQGRTQQQIADELRVTRGAVTQILARVDKRFLADLGALQQREKVRQSSILDHLLSEATQAWEKSKEAFKSSTKRVRKTPQRQSASGALIGELESELDELLSQVAESRYGDPRFLDVADRLMASKRKLWGLDIAPAPQNPHLNPLDKLSPDELDRIATRLEQQLTDARTSRGSR